MLSVTCVIVILFNLKFPTKVKLQQLKHHENIFKILLKFTVQHKYIYTLSKILKCLVTVHQFRLSRKHILQVNFSRYLQLPELKSTALDQTTATF